MGNDRYLGGGKLKSNYKIKPQQSLSKGWENAKSELSKAFDFFKKKKKKKNEP